MCKLVCKFGVSVDGCGRACGFYFFGWGKFWVRIVRCMKTLKKGMKMRTNLPSSYLIPSYEAVCIPDTDLGLRHSEHNNIIPLIPHITTCTISPFTLLLPDHLPSTWKKINLYHFTQSTPPETTNAEWHMWIIRERRLRREDTFKPSKPKIK